MSSVIVPIIPDKIVEGVETFDITLGVPPIFSKGIARGGRNKAVVTIIDSTGKYITM